MNYDTQQYTFSHGLATTPQVHIQHHVQQQQFQQQQIFPQQYTHSVPTSGIYQFQFAGGNNMFHQKETHPLGLSGGMHHRLGQNGMVTQPYIKQGMSFGIDRNTVHAVSGMDGVLYLQQKNGLKFISNPDNRMVQQSDAAFGLQQAIVGVDIMGNSSFIEQNHDNSLNQTLGVTGQGNMFAYNKQQFTSWLQPQNNNTSSNDSCQSTLPPFNHLWSQFQNQKQIGVVPQHHYHSQQFQNLHQQAMHTQQYASTSFQTLPSIQMIKMQHQNQKSQQLAIPVSIPPTQSMPSQLNCISPKMSPKVKDTGNNRNFNQGKGNASLNSTLSFATSHNVSSCDEKKSSTAVTYTISGPPKVTVTLDSLNHCDTFPANNFQEKSVSNFNPDLLTQNNLGGNLKESENIPEKHVSSLQHHWQSIHQRSQYIPKKFHTSSTGSSLERSSSEASNFSSPPYSFTPPSSADSLFSPVPMSYSKGLTECSTIQIPIYSSPALVSLVTSPSVLSMQSSGEKQNISALPNSVVPMALSVSSSITTTVTSTLASSDHHVDLTTTSVTSTSPCSRENASISDKLLKHRSVGTEKDSSCDFENKQISNLSADTNKVKVPFCWQRNLENGVIEYKSPSGEILQSIDQICKYLLSDTTCKCGLECPLQVETFFNFDPEIGSQPWSVTTNGEDLGNLCNHRREIIALAAFHNSRTNVAEKLTDNHLQVGKKRFKKTLCSGEGLIVSPLKKLKTSITQAVNKHALFSEKKKSSLHDLAHKTNLKPSSANETLHFPDEDYSIFKMQQNFTKTDFSCQVNPISQLGQATYQEQSDVDEETKKINSSILLNGRQTQTFLNQSQHASKVRLSLNLEGIKELDADSSKSSSNQPNNAMQNHKSVKIAKSDKLQMQYLQEQHNLHHSAPLINSSMFSRDQVGLLTAQHSPERFDPTLWQSNSANSSTACSHHQSSMPYPANYLHADLDQSPCPKHSTPQITQSGIQVWLDSKKSPKRLKNKRDKRKLVNSIASHNGYCNTSINKATKSTVISSSSVSFFENPTVFVEQQTAIINNSIASCKIACSSPSPMKSDSSKHNYCVSLKKNTVSTTNSEIEVAPKSLYFLEQKEIDNLNEEHKLPTDSVDVDKEKSFTEISENDSAYLSQTGSDIDRSETSESFNESNLNSSQVCHLIQPEECDTKSALTKESCPTFDKSASSGLLSKLAETQSTLITSKLERKKIKIKPRPKILMTKEESILDPDLLKKNHPSTLSGDLSQLLACNNWNISALQQILAQYSSSDPGQFNAAIQQVISQASLSGLEFPASNLLSAAARAQVNVLNKQPALITSCVGSSALNSVSEALMPASINTVSNSDHKVTLSNSLCGPILNPVIPHLHQHSQQPSTCLQQIGNNTNLIGNMMQFQQLPSGNFAMNMILPVCCHSQTYTTDSNLTGTFTTEHELKTSVSGTSSVNPLMAQGILATVPQPSDIGPQLKISVASVIPSNLGPNVAQCSQDTMLLNSFDSRMIMNNSMPPVSLSVVTNVTKSLAQVVPTIGINQTMFNSQQLAQQLMNTQQNTAQIINSAAAPSTTHMINSSTQGQQLVSSSQHNNQFLSPSSHGSQLINSASHGTQIMSALSVQGLNNQLLITNPIQQVSPSNPMSQLSPAIAAHILTQGHQHLQQMSPSFLQSHIQKQSQNSLINNQSIFAGVSLPTLTVTSDHSDIQNSISQPNILNSFQNVHRSDEQLEKAVDRNSCSQVKESNITLPNTSLYASAGQPVFVIPQPNNNPIMQVLGASQLNSASNLSADLTHLIGSSSAVDHTLLQNLINAGFSPMMNAVNINGVQQQQQFQILQLQQLLLQQLQNQGQNVHGISLPLNQNASAGQATIGAQAIMNTVVPQQNIQLNSVVDINAIHSSLSPVAQGYQNQLSPATAQLHHISSALAVHQVTPTNTCGAVGVIHNGVQNLMQAPSKSFSSVVATVQSQEIPPDQFPHRTNEHFLGTDFNLHHHILS
ncbi:uncharacterized protein LOC131928309 isoform X2 [Physella acuta]|uniref:uncharacterized protein LOC131928309 isoform X2 n=1 Tax=Physella acuta TaxID=109671 RepID=UPI0027DDF13F|nr:uncharacterized protein LOC131928309 isoform X2 [Physella acuta]